MTLPVATGGEAWRWLRRELGRRRLEVAATVGVGLLGAAASVVPVNALGVLVDRVRAGAPAGTLAGIGAVIGVAALVAGATTGLAAYLVARAGGRILAELREATVERALRLPTATLDRAGRGELLSRVGPDVAAVGRVVSEILPTMISSVLLAILSLAAMTGIDWRLGLAGAVALPLYAIGLRWYLPRSAPVYRAEREAIADRSRLLVESMLGRPTVHAYRLEERHLRGIDGASARARDLAVGVFRLFTRLVGRVNRAEFVGVAAIVVVGWFLVRAGHVTVGQTAAAAVLFHRLFNPIGGLLFSFAEIQAAGAALSRLVGVVTIPREDGEPATAVPEGPDLVLDGVRFGYDGGDVLHGVTVRVEPGTRVALVGSSGAGKTTLAALAAGLLRPREGTVSVGGVVRDLDGLRACTAIVTQETHVFAGPLVEDLRLARPDATEAEVEAALERIGALGWVRALPEGLATVVGEGGHALTAAQAQQLALARVVLADPPVAILDEATAEAGSLGARDLERSAFAATEGRTTLVVAHRLTQAAAADRIVVLDGGKVVEEGDHAELVAAGGAYARLWQAWEARTAGPL
ncbi:ABC transporter ATP-binding protein [Dactylosporangium sucinum]|uniref:ABC transporter permease n=1 Tax=Dactylosporangium sucinum TaxID=1424081 RepID=A0A917TGB9_9ACTN|nr:ABC transporter ATP-binding protein [Dactylosporangium sucinum]GGM21582.1 ABC transporter permease [Dactylosporangium sucinum]